jgi:hypothetical protein
VHSKKPSTLHPPAHVRMTSATKLSTAGHPYRIAHCAPAFDYRIPLHGSVHQAPCSESSLSQHPGHSLHPSRHDESIRHGPIQVAARISPAKTLRKRCAHEILTEQGESCRIEQLLAAFRKCSSDLVHITQPNEQSLQWPPASQTHPPRPVLGAATDGHGYSGLCNDAPVATPSECVRCTSRVSSHPATRHCNVTPSHGGTTSTTANLSHRLDLSRPGRPSQSSTALLCAPTRATLLADRLRHNSSCSVVSENAEQDAKAPSQPPVSPSINLGLHEPPASPRTTQPTNGGAQGGNAQRRSVTRAMARKRSCDGQSVHGLQRTEEGVSLRSRSLASDCCAPLATTSASQPLLASASQNALIPLSVPLAGFPTTGTLVPAETSSKFRREEVGTLACHAAPSAPSANSSLVNTGAAFFTRRNGHAVAYTRLHDALMNTALGNEADGPLANLMGLACIAEAMIPRTNACERSDDRIGNMSRDEFILNCEQRLKRSQRAVSAPTRSLLVAPRLNCGAPPVDAQTGVTASPRLLSSTKLCYTFLFLALL